MARFLRIFLAVLVAGVLMGVVGMLGDQSVLVAGMPAVCVDLGETPCWLAFGGGRGVLVVGLAGVGLVSLTIYGAGVFFATGQLAAGAIAIGQVGVGVIGWIGQVGAGTTGLGQLIFGGWVVGQLPIGGDGTAFLEALRAQLDSTLGPIGTSYKLDL